MATCTQTRGDELAAIDTEARKCVRAIRADGDFHYDRGQAALAAQSNGAVYIPPFDEPSEPVSLWLRVDELLPVGDGESPREVLISWLCDRISELRKVGA